jgi:hypothetical protein
MSQAVRSLEMCWRMRLFPTATGRQKSSEQKDSIGLRTGADHNPHSSSSLKARRLFGVLHLEISTHSRPARSWPVRRKGEAMRSQLLLTSQSKKQETSASTDKLRQVNLERRFFASGSSTWKMLHPDFRFGWKHSAEWTSRGLERLFSRALRTCKFFPKVSEILEPL